LRQASPTRSPKAPPLPPLPGWHRPGLARPLDRHRPRL